MYVCVSSNRWSRELIDRVKQRNADPTPVRRLRWRRWSSLNCEKRTRKRVEARVAIWRKLGLALPLLVDGWLCGNLRVWSHGWLQELVQTDASTAAKDTGWVEEGRDGGIGIITTCTAKKA